MYSTVEVKLKSANFVSAKLLSAMFGKSSFESLQLANIKRQKVAKTILMVNM
jgi:hypothetical protein